MEAAQRPGAWRWVLTPLVPPPPQTHASAGRRASLFLAGFFAGLLVISAVSALLVMRSWKKATEGWQLRPVVVAAVDLFEDQDLTMDMISQRSIPEQFLAGDEVLPEEATKVIGHRSFLALQAGDPLRHSYFAGSAAGDGCVMSVRAMANELGTASQPAVGALLEALAKTPAR